MLELTKGNILEADTDALVNTVNTEGVMGKGIALQFKKKFPKMYEAYRRACEAGEVVPGRMNVFEQSEMLNPRYIINFPTKRHWRSRAKMEDIKAGLVALKKEIQNRAIRSVAVPPLGCGNGGLEWRNVRRVIERGLSGLSGVQIFLYAPAGTPVAAAIVHKTKRPAMNASRAIVLKIWQEYFVLGYQLTLLEVHKLLYFLQESGEPLRLRFEKGAYGPYADNLRHLLHSFEGHFTMGFGDGRNKPDTQIELLPSSTEEATAYLHSNRGESDVSMARLKRVAELIEGFESPYGMELLATVHWAATREVEGNEFERTKAAVFSWSARKRKLLKSDHVRLAWNRLQEKGWLR
jgi:O-acetyl-ADP-ribose deacetylase (regulator of RNase III)